jgi:hypothetical protein
MRQKMFRKRSYIEADVLGTADSNVVLFEANEACTIRRIIGYISVRGNLTNSQVTNFSIEVAPNGVVVNSAFSGQALDQDVSQEYLGGGILSPASSGSIAYTDSTMWESKGMRKLRKGDQLVLSHSSNFANGSLSAYFDIFASI